MRTPPGLAEDSIRTPAIVYMDKDYTRTPSGLLKEGILIILVESMSSFLIIELEVDWSRTGQGVQKTHLAGQSTHNPSPILE